MLVDLGRAIEYLGGLAGGINPGNIGGVLDSQYGRFWKESPNIIYLSATNSATVLAELFLNDNPAKYPNGYYKIPDSAAVGLDGVVSHTLPIEWGADTILFGVRGQVQNHLILFTSALLIQPLF